MRRTTAPEVVVVTGASAGIGRATVRAFARRGAHVALLARGRDGLEAARREVEEGGGKALVLPTDVANADAVESAADAVEREFGPLECRLLLGRISPSHRLRGASRWCEGTSQTSRFRSRLLLRRSINVEHWRKCSSLRRNTWNRSSRF